MKYLIGLDVGGTKCAVTLGRTREEMPPEMLSKVKFPTEKGEPLKVLERFKTELDGVLRENGITYSDVSGIGISCGGPLDSERGVVMSPPNLPGWDNIEICGYFSEKTGIPCRLQNDANACAVAEWKYGSGRGMKNMVFLTFGTGLGAGLILDGHLYRGQNDMAGEIGHVRLEEDGPIGYGKAGSAEGFCSGNGIRQLGVKAMRLHGPESALYKACGGDEERVNAKIIAELAYGGDPVCKGIYDKCAEKLGYTLSILCDVIDPEAVILGGIFMRSDDLLYDGIRAVMEREALVPCKVLKAGLSENIGDFAALSIAEGDY